MVIRLIALVLALTVPASTLAFHDGIELCDEGEIGYIATMLEEGGKVYTFLSKEDPPKMDTIVCQISNQQLVQIKGKSKGL